MKNVCDIRRGLLFVTAGLVLQYKQEKMMKKWYEQRQKRDHCWHWGNHGKVKVPSHFQQLNLFFGSDLIKKEWSWAALEWGGIQSVLGRSGTLVAVGGSSQHLAHFHFSRGIRIERRLRRQASGCLFDSDDWAPSCLISFSMVMLEAFFRHIPFKEELHDRHYGALISFQLKVFVFLHTQSSWTHLEENLISFAGNRQKAGSVWSWVMSPVSADVLFKTHACLRCYAETD